MSDVAMREYPLDTAHLAKGSRVSVVEIEQAFCCSRYDKSYRLVVLRARKFIELRLAERGLDVVTRSERDDIVILTDEAAAPFTDAEFQNTCRKLARTLRKQQSVDRSNLTEDTCKEHDRNLLVNGASFIGLRRARRDALSPTPRSRLTPGYRKKKP